MVTCNILPSIFLHLKKSSEITSQQLSTNIRLLMVNCSQLQKSTQNSQSNYSTIKPQIEISKNYRKNWTIRSYSQKDITAQFVGIFIIILVNSCVDRYFAINLVVNQHINQGIDHVNLPLDKLLDLTPPLCKALT